MDAETLLNGPRGRGLCLQILIDAWSQDSPHADADLTDVVFRLGTALKPQDNSVTIFGFEDVDGEPLSKLGAAFAERKMRKQMDRDKKDPSSLLNALATGINNSTFEDPTREHLLAALIEQVGSAQYWEEPEGLDLAAATPQIRKALEPIAQRIAPLCSWAQAPLNREQAWMETGRFGNEDEPDNPDGLLHVAQALRRSRDNYVKNEHEHHPKKDPTREISTAWWSDMGNSPQTTGITGAARIPGPVSLYCSEDCYRDDVSVQFRRLQVQDTDRVLEIRSRQDWANLCQRFPLDVTKRYRGSWFLSTGRDSLAPVDGTDPGWVIPDLATAAEAYDGVHLTVAAYLECSGAVIPVPPSDGNPLGASMVAGWSPDVTVWLSDRVAIETACWTEDDTVELDYGVAYKRI